MERILSRALGCALAIFCFLSFGHIAQDYDTSAYAPPQPETHSLEEIYQAALAEGGKLAVYAGGDVPGRQRGH